ncbi:MAG TPA: hypothetical protein VN939_24030, partial [Chthoniobacterales bacterium]|nr:hypothetical protein [Chthoniobacterales bacterium]
MTRRLQIGFSICLYCFCVWRGLAQSQYESSTDFAKYAIKLRENGLLVMQGKQRPQPAQKTPSLGETRAESGSLSNRVSGVDGEPGRYPWRLSVMTTIFWIGEHPSTNNPVPNDASSWDPNWSVDYGGYDDPNLNLRKKF